MRHRRRRPKLLPISMCHSKLFGIVLAWFHCPRLSPPCADTPCRRRLGRRPTTTFAVAASCACVYLLRVRLVIVAQERDPCELHSYVHRRPRLINRHYRASSPRMLRMRGLTELSETGVWSVIEQRDCFCILIAESYDNLLQGQLSSCGDKDVGLTYNKDKRITKEKRTIQC